MKVAADPAAEIEHAAVLQPPTSPSAEWRWPLVDSGTDAVPVDKWEYGELKRHGNAAAVTWHGPDGSEQRSDDFIEELNQLGAMGWELVGTTATGYLWHYVLRRRLL